MEKIGVGVITCNRPEFLRNLIHSLIPCEKSIDEFVVVNDGKPITDYDLPFGEWIDNEVNLGVGKSKNKALKYLYEKGCDFIFLIEEDMIIKNSDIFTEYINASKKSGIEHMMFAYHGPANKRGVSGGQPSPRVVIDYDYFKISLNQHCVGAFCFYTRRCIDMIGFYDENYLNAFEHVDHSYMLAKKGLSTPYWWWADLANSTDYISEQACSENSSSIRPRKDWQNNIKKSAVYFENKHSVSPVSVPDTSVDDIVFFLKSKK